VGYTGNIAINKPEGEAAKKVMVAYKATHIDEVDMWS